MKIRMFDCGFGDCFNLIDNHDNSLYVDFGIHIQSMNKVNREARYDKIINLIQDKSDFLLTHYHDDHYAGALYMGKKGKKFHNVYIPDIWNIDGSIQVITLLLLRGFFTKSVIKNNLSLIQFIIHICHFSGQIFFVKRNTCIQDSYIALWPDENYIRQRADKYYDSLNYDENILKRLYHISEKLRECVLNLEGTEGAEAREGTVAELESLEQNYQELAQEFAPKKSLQCKLTQFGNSISILFQNIKNDKNILFTGDIGKEDIWDFIENNQDKLVSMHSFYDVIKIPHHGTCRYYHSFIHQCKNYTTFMIPNGVIKNPRWYMDLRYSLDSRLVHCSVHCSDNQACNAVFNNMCRCYIHNLCHNSNGYIDIFL